jgi:hypothetical protein
MIVIWQVTRQGYGCSGETSWLAGLLSTWRLLAELSAVLVLVELQQ